MKFLINTSRYLRPFLEQQKRRYFKQISEDVSKVRMYLGPAILYTLNLVFLLSFVIFRMVYTSPELTLWVLIPLPLLSFLIYKISSLINLRSEIIQQKLAV